MKPLAIDLFCGLGGWAEGLMAEGYDVIGFDIERHEYGDMKYPAQLVIQDVLTLHGSQFKDAALIVASPPCQFFSYTAMPWSRAKALAAEVRADPVRLEKELALFKACFRIQREACEAAGRHIPMVVENVRGAEPWVGRSAAKYGSFYLWGDVPALMPITRTRKLGGGASWYPPADPRHKPGLDFTRLAGTKVAAIDGGRRTDVGKGARFTSRDCGAEGTKIGGDWFSDSQSTCRRHSSKSNARKAASAMIAKIPAPLARWIAHAWKPATAHATTAEELCRCRNEYRPKTACPYCSTPTHPAMGDEGAQG